METPGKTGVLSEKVRPEGERIKPPTPTFTITVPLANAAAEGQAIDLRVSVQSFVCSKTSNLCRIQSYVWNVPVRFSADKKPGEPIALSTPPPGSKSRRGVVEESPSDSFYQDSTFQIEDSRLFDLESSIWNLQSILIASGSSARGRPSPAVGGRGGRIG